MKDGLEVHAGQLAGARAPRVELGLARHGHRQLTADVLDLGKQAQRLEIVGVAIEDIRDFGFRSAQDSHLDQDSGVAKHVPMPFRGLDGDVGRAHWKIPVSPLERSRTVTGTSTPMRFIRPPRSRVCR
jgi:hypothetical protein